MEIKLEDANKHYATELARPWNSPGRLFEIHGTVTPPLFQSAHRHAAHIALARNNEGQKTAQVLIFVGYCTYATWSVATTIGDAPKQSIEELFADLHLVPASGLVESIVGHLDELIRKAEVQEEVFYLDEVMGSLESMPRETERSIYVVEDHS